MIWFILSIPISFGVAFIVYGISVPQIIDPTTAIACGSVIILVSLWIGIRAQRHRRLTQPITDFREAFVDILLALRDSKPDERFQIPEYFPRHLEAKTKLEMKLTPKGKKQLNKIWDQYMDNTKDYYIRLGGVESSSSVNWPKKFLKEIDNLFTRIDKIRR